jgi:hypothetical protein
MHISYPEHLPYNLQVLRCDNNLIRYLPISLLECRNLRNFYCYNNPIDNIHPAIIRLINGTKNRELGIYNDTQSVHNSNVQESIKKSIMNILKDR